MHSTLIETTVDLAFSGSDWLGKFAFAPSAAVSLSDFKALARTIGSGPPSLPSASQQASAGLQRLTPLMSPAADDADGADGNHPHLPASDSSA